MAGSCGVENVPAADAKPARGGIWCRGGGVRNRHGTDVYGGGGGEKRTSGKLSEGHTMPMGDTENPYLDQTNSKATEQTGPRGVSTEKLDEGGSDSLTMSKRGKGGYRIDGADRGG